MKVAHVQQYLSNLITLLQETGGKGPAGDLGRLAAALEPFREMSLGDLAEFLRKAEEYQRTGVLAATPPRARSRAGADPEKVKQALDSLRRLYDRATAGDLTFEEVHEEIKRQEKALNKEEAMLLAQEFGVVGSFDSKPQALSEVGRKITEHLADTKRRQF